MHHDSHEIIKVTKLRAHPLAVRVCSFLLWQDKKELPLSKRINEVRQKYKYPSAKKVVKIVTRQETMEISSSLGKSVENKLGKWLLPRPINTLTR